MNVNHHLSQSLCLYTSRQVSVSVVLDEVDTATFVCLWGNECLMVLAVSVPLCFLKKNCSHYHF